MLRHRCFRSCVVVIVVVLAFGWTFGSRVPSDSERAFLEHLRVDRMLDQPVGLTAVDVPLAEVLQSLSQQYDVPIHLHQAALTGPQGVTIDVHNVRLRSLLSLILQSHDLEFAVRGCQVVVSSLATLGSSPAAPIARLYPLTPPPLGWRSLGEAEMSNLVRWTIAPHSWGPSGGGEIIQVPGALVVVHLPEIHIRIMDLLLRLESCRFPTDPTAVIRLQPHPESRFEQRLHRVLAQPARVEFFHAPLPAALGCLSRDFDVPIVVQPQVWNDAAVQRRMPVTITARHATLATALREILAPLGLSFRVDRDVIEVLRPSWEVWKREYRLYPVADLTRNQSGGDVNRLAELVNRLVVRSDLEAHSDFCSARSVSDRMLLIEATAELHDRARRFLEELRTCLLMASPLPDRVVISDRPQDAALPQARCFDVRPLVDRDLGVMTEPILHRFLKDLCESKYEMRIFDGVLVVRAPQHELTHFADVLDRLTRRLASLPRYREFVAAHCQGQAGGKVGFTQEENVALHRMYLDALHAAIR